MFYSLIIPIFNEERIVPKLLNKLQKLNNKKIEIIIINDGSNDGTKNILDNNSQFIIKHNEINLGKGASILKGLELASSKNIIIIDGDLEIDINDIPKLILDYENDKSDFVTKYIQLLSSGGSKHHSDLLAPFNLDATNPEFWNTGISLISGMIGELEEMNGIVPGIKDCRFECLHFFLLSWLDRDSYELGFRIQFHALIVTREVNE